MSKAKKQEDELLQEITTLCKNERQSAEMMQGCSNYTVYAEITAEQILAKVKEKGWKSPEQISGLEDKVAALIRERDGDVWYWLGDGNDHPESLCCPILIEPEDIMQMVKWDRKLVELVLGLSLDPDSQLWEDEGFLFMTEETKKRRADQLKKILGGE